MNRNRGLAILRDLDEDDNDGNAAVDPTTLASPRWKRPTWKNRHNNGEQRQQRPSESAATAAAASSASLDLLGSDGGAGRGAGQKRKINERRDKEQLSPQPVVSTQDHGSVVVVNHNDGDNDPRQQRPLSQQHPTTPAHPVNTAVDNTASFRGIGDPVSPFSPLFNRQRNGNNSDGPRVNWKDEALSLSICRKVSVVVLLRQKSTTTANKSATAAADASEAAAADDKTTCIFPPGPDPRPTEISREIIVVNPKAFGNALSANSTMDTARLAAEVADTADWARSYKFHQVVWPNQRNNALENLTQALANDILAPGSIAQRLVVGYNGKTVLGHGPLTKHLYGSVAKQSVVRAFATEESKYGDEVLERYGMLGYLTMTVLPKLDHRVCSVSVVEVVGQDHLYDLLLLRPYSSQNPVKVKLNHHEACAVVTGLSETKVDSVKQLGHLVRRAFAAALHVARKSPRGHILTVLSIHDAADPSRRTACRFLDLACTDTPVDRKAILALGAVLRSIFLREAGNESPVTFRGALLTKVLQKSMIQTDSRVVVLASASTSNDEYEPTMHTLRFMDHLLARPGDPVRSPFHHGTGHFTTSMATTEEHFAGQEGKLLQEVLSDPRQRLAKVIKSAKKERRNIQFSEAYLPRMSYDNPDEDDDAFLHQAAEEEEATTIDVTALPEEDDHQSVSNRKIPSRVLDACMMHGESVDHRDIEPPSLDNENTALPSSVGDKDQQTLTGTTKNQMPSNGYQKEASSDKTTRILQGRRHDEREALYNHSGPPQKDEPTLLASDHNAQRVETTSRLPPSLKNLLEPPGFDMKLLKEDGILDDEHSQSDDRFQNGTSLGRNGRFTFDDDVVDEEEDARRQLDNHESVTRHHDGEVVLHYAPQGFRSRPLLRGSDGDGRVDGEPHKEIHSLNGDERSNHNLHDGDDENADHLTHMITALSSWDQDQVEVIGPPDTHGLLDEIDERDKSNYRYDLMEEGRVAQCDNIDTHNLRGDSPRPGGDVTEVVYQIDNDIEHPSSVRDEGAIIDDGASTRKRAQLGEQEHHTSAEDDAIMVDGTRIWNHDQPGEPASAQGVDYSLLNDFLRENRQYYMRSVEENDAASSSSVDPEIQSLAAGVDRLDKQLRELGRRDTFDEDSRDTDIDETHILNHIVDLTDEYEIESASARYQSDGLIDPLKIIPQTSTGQPPPNVNARIAGSYDGSMNPHPEQVQANFLCTGDPAETHVSNSKWIDGDIDGCDLGSEGEKSLGDRRRMLLKDPPTQQDFLVPAKGLYVANGGYTQQIVQKEDFSREPVGKGASSIENGASSASKCFQVVPERSRIDDNKPIYVHQDDIVDGPIDTLETLSNLSSVGEDAKKMSDVEQLLRRCEEEDDDVDVDPSDNQSLDSLLREIQSNPDDSADLKNALTKHTSQAERVALKGTLPDHTNHHDQSRTPITRNTSVVRTYSWNELEMKKDIQYDLPPDSPAASSADSNSVDNSVVSSRSALVNDDNFHVSNKLEVSLGQRKQEAASYALISSPSRTISKMKPASVDDEQYESDNHSAAASSLISGDIHYKCSDGDIMVEAPNLRQTRDVSASPGRSSGMELSVTSDDRAADRKHQGISSRSLDDSPSQEADYSGDEKHVLFERPLIRPSHTGHPYDDRSSFNEAQVVNKHEKHDAHSLSGRSPPRVAPYFTAPDNHNEDDKWSNGSRQAQEDPDPNQEAKRAFCYESNGDRSQRFGDRPGCDVQPTRRDSSYSAGMLVTEGLHHLNDVLQNSDLNEHVGNGLNIKLHSSSENQDPESDGMTKRAEFAVGERESVPTQKTASAGHGEKSIRSTLPQDGYVKKYVPVGEMLDAASALPISVAPVFTDGLVYTKESGDDRTSDVAHGYFEGLNRPLGSASSITRSFDDRGDQAGMLASRQPTKESQLSGNDDKCLYEIDELEAAVDEVRRTNSNVWQASLVSIENLRKFQASQKASLMSLRHQRDEAIQRATLLQAKLGEATAQYQRSLVSKETEIEKLGTELSEVKSVRKEVVKIAEEAISTQAELEAKLSELQLQLENSVSTEAYDSLRRECDLSRMQLETAQKQFTKMKMAVNEQKEALMAAKEELAIKGVENRELELDLSVQKDNNSLLQRQLSTYKERSDENMASIRQQLVGLAKELKAAKENAAKLEDDNGRMTALLENRTSEHLENRDNLESELRKRDGEATAWMRERKDLLGEVERLKDLVNQHDRGNADLREEVRRTEEQRKMLQGRVGQTEDELEKRNKAIAELSSRVEHLLAQKQEDRQKVADMEASLASFQETTRSKVEKVVRHRKEAAALLDKTIEENKSLESTNETLKETIEQLERELVGLRNRPPSPPHLLTEEGEERDRDQNRRGLAIDRSGAYGRPPRRRPDHDGGYARPLPRDDGRTRQQLAHHETSGGLERTTVDDITDLTAHLALSAKGGSGHGNIIGNVRGIYSTIFTLDEAKDDELCALKRRIKALERQNASYGHV